MCFQWRVADYRFRFNFKSLVALCWIHSLIYAPFCFNFGRNKYPDLTNWVTLNADCQYTRLVLIAWWEQTGGGLLGTVMRQNWIPLTWTKIMLWKALNWKALHRSRPLLLSTKQDVYFNGRWGITLGSHRTNNMTWQSPHGDLVWVWQSLSWLTLNCMTYNGIWY